MEHMTLYQHFSPRLQKYVHMSLFLLLIGVVSSSFAFAFSYFVSAWDTATNRIAPRQLSVSGEGTVALRPDTAVFSAGVMTEAKKVGDAQAENTKRSNTMLGFLKEQGIAEKDIKTIGYAVLPQYHYFDVPPCRELPCPPRRPPEIISYEVRHTIEVKVRDLDKTDELLEGTVAQGANEIGSIQFRVDDEEKARTEARGKAIEDARTKARALAKYLGVRLGKVAGFSESGQGFPVFARTLEGKGGFGGDTAPAPQVEPGEEEIRSHVTIMYEFR